MDAILALDAGTTGVRTVAFGPGTEVLATAYRELTQYFPAPGEVEHDPLEIARLAHDTLDDVAQQLAAAGHRPVALGITNQRETTVAFDRHTGDVHHRAIVWQDRRTAPLCDELAARGLLPAVRQRTGLVLDSYFSGTKMRWLADHGALDGAVTPSFATVDAYLVWVLTGGAVFATEPSNASRTLLMDLATLSWSSEMLDMLSLDVTALPEIRPSLGDFGTVATVPSLRGLPITAVLGDQQAALFGQACFSVGMVKATYGTGSFILAHAGSTVPSPRDGLISTVAWDAGPHGGVSYAYEGSAFVAGAAIQWLRDELGVIARADEVGPLAESVSDSGGVLFVPAFTGLGSPFWRSDARGSLMGLSRGSGRAQIARAVVESLAYQVRAMTDAFTDAGVPMHELRADGGAAAMEFLLAMQATQSRVPVVRSTSLEATARGAATAAGLQVGQWGSMAELATLWSSDFRAEPGDPTFADLGYDAWLRAAQRA